MKKINSHGFTLIELLVVIAIIGLLASVVLVSVGGARSKASNAAIKINLEKITAITSAEIMEKGYTTLTSCPAAGSTSGNKDFDNACVAIVKSGGGTPVITFSAPSVSVAGGTGSGGSVAAQASLVGSSAGTWVVDSAGAKVAGTAGTGGSAGVAVPAGTSGTTS